MTKFDVPDETGESTEHELRLGIARRLHLAMCAQYPDRLITLCDGDGRLLATSRRDLLYQRPVQLCPLQLVQPSPKNIRNTQPTPDGQAQH
jgi:hypothetical protein